ncbi:hypothetical protein V6N13_098180 [Hibiscus sabdariffa]|uniref:Uncharacterized protein n=1 Tax=Hibiscus sabdariffa TaxID=183260 RepID=A0ABR2EDF0_9ROSI
MGILMVDRIDIAAAKEKGKAEPAMLKVEGDSRGGLRSGVGLFLGSQSVRFLKDFCLSGSGCVFENCLFPVPQAADTGFQFVS